MVGITINIDFHNCPVLESVVIRLHRDLKNRYCQLLCLRPVLQPHFGKNVGKSGKMKKSAQKIGHTGSSYIFPDSVSVWWSCYPSSPSSGISRSTFYRWVLRLRPSSCLSSWDYMLTESDARKEGYIPAALSNSTALKQIPPEAQFNSLKSDSRLHFSHSRNVPSTQKS